MQIESTAVEQVVVRFTVTDGDHSYSDALILTPDEHAKLDAKQIEVMQQERFANWKAVVTAPPREVTDEEKAAQIEDLKAQLDATQDTLLALLPDDEKLVPSCRSGQRIPMRRSPRRRLWLTLSEVRAEEPVQLSVKGR
jgi:RAB protein geranylgeranyltransferase component A